MIIVQYFKKLLNEPEDEVEIIYDLIVQIPNELERLVELLVRIFGAQNNIINKFKLMANFEIDGDPNSANILFRSKTLLTKSLEYYLRNIGREFLKVSVGDIIKYLCEENIEIEIDPSRLKTGGKERSPIEQATDLNRWTTYMWNSLYQSRHRCPK